MTTNERLQIALDVWTERERTRAAFIQLVDNIHRKIKQLKASSNKADDFNVRCLWSDQATGLEEAERLVKKTLEKSFPALPKPALASLR